MAASKRRRRGKKKNPSKAQLIVLGVGGVIGFTLLGVGIYVAVKKPQGGILPPGGAPEGGSIEGAEWGYQISQDGRWYTATVYPPAGDPVTLRGRIRKDAAIRVAKRYVSSRGGIPVPV